MAVNFTKNQQAIASAWKDVAGSKTDPRWALFGYEPNSNNIVLMAQGSKGLKELVSEFNCTLIQYALCRVIDAESGINKLILINWQGESAPLTRKGLCASHVTDVVAYFKGCSHTVTLRNEDDASEQYILDHVKKNSSKITFSKSSNNTLDSIEPLERNASQNKIDISKELAMNRKSFWEKQEEEERKRLDDEKKKAAEKRALFDKERKQREEAENKKLEETIRQRDLAIEATRQAEKDQFGALRATVAKEKISDEDDRVGRRSELLRHERSQETSSLISKGLIKNKKAMFEEACAKQQQPHASQFVSSAAPTRKTSGVITERLNAFSTINNTAPSKAENRAASPKAAISNLQAESKLEAQDVVDETVVRKNLETVKIVNDEESDRKCTITHVPSIDDEEHTSIVPSADNDSSFPKQVDEIIRGDGPLKNSQTSLENEQIISNGSNEKSHEKGDDDDEIKHLAKQTSQVSISHENVNCTEASESDLNGNNSAVIDDKDPIVSLRDESSIIKGNGTCAKALFDYQAADETEISFDPDDIIGRISKVDEGWWHGQVLSGTFLGKSGLFPSNYVAELPKMSESA